MSKISNISNKGNRAWDIDFQSSSEFCTDGESDETTDSDVDEEINGDTNATKKQNKKQNNEVFANSERINSEIAKYDILQSDRVGPHETESTLVVHPHGYNGEYNITPNNKSPCKIKPRKKSGKKNKKNKGAKTTYWRMYAPTSNRGLLPLTKMELSRKLAALESVALESKLSRNQTRLLYMIRTKLGLPTNKSFLNKIAETHDPVEKLQIIQDAEEQNVMGRDTQTDQI